MSELIVRIAARGDGVTASGRHMPFAAPGDRLLDNGALETGPAHRTPPCSLFPRCGGCQLQHLTDAAYADYCVSRVAGALDQHGLEAKQEAPYLSPANSRRRASLRALNAGGRVVIGFNESGSNRIVDLTECHVLHPDLFKLLSPIRTLMRGLLPPRRVATVQMTVVDQGIDLMLGGMEISGLDAVEQLTRFCEDNRLARLSVDEGYGAETRFEPRPVTVTLGGVAVPFPPGSFLQATADGEAALVEEVRQACRNAGRVADLFAGLGTFALSLDGQVTAVEAARDAALALRSAVARVGRPLSVQHRDLYRRPLDRSELTSFDCVILDPPRAGAAEQVKELAQSRVPRLAYVSCNPATFARDASTLASGGYRLEHIRAIGQFRWSTHVELVATFNR